MSCLTSSVEGWVSDSRQGTDRSTFPFEESEGEDEKANTHDGQNDHSGDERACHCVYLKHWSFQMGQNNKNTKRQSNMF